MSFLMTYDYNTLVTLANEGGHDYDVLGTVEDALMGWAEAGMDATDPEDREYMTTFAGRLDFNQTLWLYNHFLTATATR